MTAPTRPPGEPGPTRPPGSRAGAVGVVTAELVPQVQRRLAAHAAVAGDTAGLRAAVAETLAEDGILLPEASLAALVRSVADELTGLGPLAPLLADPAVTDVLVNGPAEVWVERGGTIERAPVRFPSADAVAALVQRVVAPLGLRIDEARPWVDARLPGGERFHAVLPPLAPDGPVVTIRTFARRRLHLHDLIERDALDAATARLLEAMVAAGIAIAVSGATGTGKTTLLIVTEWRPTRGCFARGDRKAPVGSTPRSCYAWQPVDLSVAALMAVQLTSLPRRDPSDCWTHQLRRRQVPRAPTTSSTRRLRTPVGSLHRRRPRPTGTPAD